ncbi:MAG: PQQ-binding-like beta-propeller repeat protein, partial [Candidatus Bathyarchaeia archaeon]
GVGSSPAIGADGTVYVGLNDGYLYAINASTGLKIWEFRTGAAIKCTPAIYDGKVFFGSGHGRPPHDYNFYALDAERGMLMWKKTLAYDTISSAAIRDGIVYVGSGQWVYALNASDGREVWVYQLPDGNIIESSPAVTPTKVYITGGNWSTWETIGPTGSLYALNRTTGQLIWTVGTTFTRISPSVAGSTVYLGTYNTTKLTAPKNYFYALDGDTGAILWNHPLQYISTSIPAIVEGIVYFAAEGYIYAFRSIEAIVSIETDKTSYTPGETVEVSLTVVNPAGTSFPSSKVTAKITWPTGDGVTIFDSGPFTLPPKFNRTVTGKLSIPDSIFVPDGTYTFTATLTYNGNTATDTASFEIRRSTRNATRWEFDRS